MKLLLLALAALPLLLAGCMNDLDPEDRDFYYRGWVKPTDLDRDATWTRLKKQEKQTQVDERRSDLDQQRASDNIRDRPYKKDPLVDE